MAEFPLHYGYDHHWKVMALIADLIVLISEHPLLDAETRLIYQNNLSDMVWSNNLPEGLRTEMILRVMGMTKNGA